MILIKIDSKVEEDGGLNVFSSFDFGDDTPPEQSFKEIIDVVVMFARLTAEEARKTGLEVSWMDVLDKLIKDLVSERMRIENAIETGSVTDLYNGEKLE